MAVVLLLIQNALEHCTLFSPCFKAALLQAARSALKLKGEECQKKVVLIKHSTVLVSCYQNSSTTGDVS